VTISRYALLSVFITSLLACSKPQETITEQVERPVKLLTVESSSQGALRKFPAEVEANQGSYLSFRVSGQLTSLPVLAGQHVEKGQVLATLDKEDFLLQVKDRTARFDLAKSQLERTQALYQKGIASQAELDNAVANLSVAQSALEKAEQDLDYTHLKAPFSGTVSKLFIKNHESIVAKQNIMRLEQRDYMDVTIYVPEKIVAQVKKDLDYSPTVVFDSYPTKSFALAIKEWDTNADPKTLSYRVVFTLPIPTEFNLLAGMTGNVFIDLSQVTRDYESYFILPNSAVFSDEQGNSFVWRYHENASLEKVQVTLGEMHKSGVEVRSGINAGDKIVSAGVHYLTATSKVRPWQKEQGL
jgi:RND family efflux transporter MFP subunit